MNRKEFLKLSTLGTASLAFSPKAFPIKKKQNIRFGIITDLHHDIMHDGEKRLQAFIGEMKQSQPDFIIQMGDFCVPKPENQALLNVWNSFKGDKFHVIGNHDTDGGYKREDVVQFWKAQDKYYSFDREGFHFIVLDGNEHNESPNRPKGYARFVSKTQIEWLEQDLDSTDLPCIVFCHQGLDNDMGGLENGMAMRYSLEKANKRAGFQKVILVFSGHHHQDYYNQINGIHYVQINSASYYWVGGEHQMVRYSEQIDEKHPWIKYTIPYKEPLWATVEISSKGRIQIEGRKTNYVGPDPKTMGLPEDFGFYPIAAEVSDRELEI
ncbi:metallophosphoesterase [Marinilongibacter aquaticus]|uniref:metallophosphoesterase family protein n=1 Tax=Marinilongibacter aquaticus TaxID=2975157 RepID=UPI0021BD7FA9|nr:metallophosphoesterase [Marinilongibacter aquaticus]UBM59055.1 metallophosphoesterase [Marinilongibacter aquaticus]